MTAPIRLSINALGGQGGGVLAGWIVTLAQAQGWWAQSTSVPGVAQRTGATVYYIELCPPDPVGREPVLALMPVPGDVDIVLAAELMEAGRAIARGLVTPERTTLIASSHRVFSIGEKSAMGDGILRPAQVLDACRTSSRALVLADLHGLAERHGSVISAALFGALAGSGALPFTRASFEAAIRAGGVGVGKSLATFAAAFDLASGPTGDNDAPTSPPVAAGQATGLAALRGRLADCLPVTVHTTATLGIERLADYQDAAYAALYLNRLIEVANAERQIMAPQEDWQLTREAARCLALWMAYEDAVRVADLKTRAARTMRVTQEAQRSGHQLIAINEFLHPRFEELCDLLPANWGKRLIHSTRARAWSAPFIDRDRIITTTKLGGFLQLYFIARLRRLRPRSYRFGEEQARIEAWLATAINAARQNPALGLEIIRCQRLVKGYGDTHARGLRNFAAIMRALPQFAGRADAALLAKGLREAALKDEEGRSLARALAVLAGP